MTSVLLASLWFGTPAIAKEPTFWKNYFLRHHRKELAVEGVPQPEAGRTVLLIPGTTIGTEFFDPMAARLHADGYRTVVFAPEDLFTGSLAVGAEQVGTEIDRVLAATGEDKLLVVAECDGGVAARYFAQVLGGHERIEHLITFVSAHNGTRLAGLGAMFTPFQAFSDIRPRSDFMTELNSAPFPEDFRMTSIYSCRDRLMKPYETSVVPGADNIEFCDHKIRHFDGFWDPIVYETIRSKLDQHRQDLAHRE